MYGTTLGKMAMGMKVVDASGARPGFWTVLLRELIVVGLPQVATIILAKFARAYPVSQQWLTLLRGTPSSWPVRGYDRPAQQADVRCGAPGASVAQAIAE
ncbi:MAG: RDD family protein [Chloroflexota bacterium]|nr:RDD family protein [Chloroflexota bacterium]MDE2885702.1 RDD family protein [Chloroflexota bacterium]